MEERIATKNSTENSTEYSDRYLTLNGCRLHYQEWGNPSAPPLLMVHGLTQQSHAFDSLARQLRGRFHCIALDVRGRGESGWASPETYNVPSYVKDVVALLDALGIERTHYVGTSMGGLIAMTLAVESPGRFLSLVMNDIGPTVNQGGLDRIAAAQGKRTGRFPSVDAYLENGLFPYFYWLKDRPRETLHEMAKWALKRYEDGTFGVKYDPAVSSGVGNAEVRSRLEEFLWKGFRNLACPILMVRGQESDLLVMETIEAMREAQPAMKLVQIPGVSHAPSLDEPEAVAAFEDFYA